MADCCFVQMTRTEILVEKSQVCPFGLRVEQLDVGIEISVFLLCCGDQFNDLVHFFLKRRVWGERQRIRSAFQPFVDIGVGPKRPAKLSFSSPGGDCEVLYRPAFFNFCENSLETLLMIGLNSRTPESIGNFYLLE